jgi:hypothetical protein
MFINSKINLKNKQKKKIKIKEKKIKIKVLKGGSYFGLDLPL